VSDENPLRIETIDERLVVLGTAHVSPTSVADVEAMIEEFEPDIIAVELDAGRLESLESERKIDEESLAKVIKEGKAPLVLAQSLLASEQRKVAETTGVMPGAEMLAAVKACKDKDLRVELVDRDVQVTLRRAWKGMSLREKWRLLKITFLPEDDEIDGEDVEAMLQDQDLLTQMLEEMRDIVPSAGIVLVDERDEYLAGRIAELRDEGKVLAIIGAGHLKGVSERLQKGTQMSPERRDELEIVPRTSPWVKTFAWLLPLAILGLFATLAVQGDYAALLEVVPIWIAMNALLAAIGAIIARGHPLVILVAALASPLTSLNPMLAAGWFAGYVQLRIDGPSAKDLQEFLALDKMSLFWSNRAGKVLLVTALVNLGSSLGSMLATWGIIAVLL